MFEYHEFSRVQINKALLISTPEHEVGFSWI